MAKGVHAVTWQTGTYLGHRRLGLSTNLLLCVSIPCDAETLISCSMLVWQQTRFCRNALSWSQEIQRMLVVYCNNLDWCHHCEDSPKALLRRVQQNRAGWTEWYIGDGDSLCTASGFTPRLRIFFPWIPPLIITHYLCNQYPPKAFHSSHCTAEVWQSLLCGGEAWNGCSGCTIRLVHFHSFTRSSAFTLTDNESTSFIPAEQTSISSESQRSSAAGADRREVPSTRASSAASQGWSASSPMTHTSSRAHSTSEHPFRKAVWTPPTQAVGCQKKSHELLT